MIREIEMVEIHGDIRINMVNSPGSKSPKHKNMDQSTITRRKAGITLNIWYRICTHLYLVTFLWLNSILGLQIEVGIRIIRSPSNDLSYTHL